MPQHILAQFRNLRPPVRSLVILFWIYSLTTSLTSVFIQLFLYQVFSSITLNAYATILFNTGIAAGFCIFGYVAARSKLNIKYGFLWSFIIMGLTLVILLKSTTPALAYLAMTINGIGNGLFWLTIHTFELSETLNEERDFYSSLLSAGTVTVSVLGPLLATALLYISGNLFHWGDFTLLFLVTPLFYLFGFFCFSTIRRYTPEPVEWADVVHFFAEYKNRIAQFYLVGTALQDVLSTITFPLVLLLILGSALKVGLYATAVAVFSALCVLILSQYRTVKNRLAILGLSTIIMAFATLWFGYVFTFIALLAYSVIGGVLWPVVRVSIHVTDLETMESIGRSNRDFYATMLFRDASLWLWRTLGGLMIVVLAAVTLGEQPVLASSLYLYALSLMLVFIGAVLLLRAMKTPSADR